MAALTNIVINDFTPSYTIFEGASCGALGTGLTACTISAPATGTTGAISWTLTGSLYPAASGSVSYTVQVQQ